MKTKVTKWGNSYGIRLPKHMVEEMQLSEDSELTLEKKGNQLTLTKPAKESQLTELLKTMTKQEELNWGEARGKEAW